MIDTINSIWAGGSKNIANLSDKEINEGIKFKGKVISAQLNSAMQAIYMMIDREQRTGGFYHHLKKYEPGNLCSALYKQGSSIYLEFFYCKKACQSQTPVINYFAFDQTADVPLFEEGNFDTTWWQRIKIIYNGVDTWNQATANLGAYQQGDRVKIIKNQYGDTTEIYNDYVYEVVSVVNNNKMNPNEGNALYTNWMIDSGVPLFALEFCKFKPWGYINLSSVQNKYRFSDYPRVQAVKTFNALPDIILDYGNGEFGIRQKSYDAIRSFYGSEMGIFMKV